MADTETIARIRAICAQVADVRGRRLEDLTAASKSPALAWPRHEAAYVAHQMTGAAYGLIGQALGARDATTIMNSLQRVTARAAADEAYRDALIALLSAVSEPSSAAIARHLLVTSSGTVLPAQVLAVCSVLADPALSDAEARGAALAIFNQEVAHV